MAEIASGGRRPKLTGSALVAHAAYTAGFRGQALLTAVAIAMAESRGNPSARKNDSIEDSVGLWQINIDPRKSWGRARARKHGGASGLMDPYENARAAYDISNQGKNFNPWSTYKQKKNSYTNWLGTAATAIRKIGLNSIEPSTRTMGNDSTRRVLRRGSKGTDVRRLQEFLGIKVDGDFGPQTESAVRSYQRSRGLKVDGVVGPQTWGSLYSGESAVRSTSRSSSSSSSSGSSSDAMFVGGSSGWVMPVAGGTYSNDWGNPRSGGRTHAGTDIFAPRGTPIRSPVAGKIKTSMYGDSGGMGGYRVWVEGDDGYDYYFAHMNGMPSVRPGQRVSAGTMVGRVGTSGNAQGTSPHLHLGIRRRGSSSWVNPYNFLRGSASNTEYTMEDFQLTQTAEDLAYQLYGAEARFFLQHRELGPILRRAASQNWDSARLEGAVTRTNWWRTTSQTERTLQALKATDPQSYRQTRTEMRRTVTRVERTVGVDLSSERRNRLAIMAMAYGWSEQDLVEYVTAESKWRGRDDLKGQLAAEWDWIKAESNNWGVPVASRWAWMRARDIVSGRSQRDNVTAYFTQMAKSRYPWLADEIDAGTTVSEYAEPYRQLAAELLEDLPENFDLSNRHMRSMLDYQRQDGYRRSMNLSEAADYLRGLPEWRKTEQAQQQYAGVASSLAEMFGARA